MSLEALGATILPSSDTQGWLRSLHRPLGLLAGKALNLLPKIDTKRYIVRSNQITALISKLFSLVILLIRKWGWNQWNDSVRSAVNRRKFNLLSQGRCSERNHPWESEDAILPCIPTYHPLIPSQTLSLSRIYRCIRLYAVCKWPVRST